MKTLITLLFAINCIVFSNVYSQSIERISFSSVASSNDNFQPIVGTPYGANLNGPGGSLEISAEYGESTYGESALSVDENNQQSNIRVYPNPTRDKVIVDLSQTLEISANILLTDLNGKVLQQHKNSESLKELDIKSYSSGTYLLHISSDGQLLQTFRIQKTN